MNYRLNPKNGDKLSALAYGCMRFPSDEKLAEKQVVYAIEQGVNYFDTAYIYPGSEATLGRILSKGYRDKIKLATKLPHYLVRKPADMEKLFQTQLERLQTDRIDYYMMHMLMDLKDWTRLVDFGVLAWIEEKKKNGQIINLGFSFHGGKKAFIDIIDAYDWDFCMIQYNYLDENHQAGTAGLKYAHEKGLPIIVMEPLRGGKLANGLPEQAVREFKAVKPDRSPAEWGLRWVLDHPEVTVVISGMNAEAQVDENIRMASEAKAGAFTPVEHEAIKKAVDIMRASIKVGCTGCGYCMPCPAGVDIPAAFYSYNDVAIIGRMHTIVMHMLQSGIAPKAPTFARQCKRCGKCEKHCPQEIKIMDELEQAAKAVEPAWVKPVARIAKVFTSGSK